MSSVCRVHSLVSVRQRIAVRTLNAFLATVLLRWQGYWLPKIFLRETQSAVPSLGSGPVSPSDLQPTPETEPEPKLRARDPRPLVEVDIGGAVEASAEASDERAIVRALEEFDAWLAAIHLQAYAPGIKATGMDIIQDAPEALEDESCLEGFQLRLFERARFLRAAATIMSEEGNSARQLELAAQVGTFLTSEGSDIFGWLETKGLQHLVGTLVEDGGMHMCDLRRVTDEQLQRAGSQRCWQSGSPALVKVLHLG